MWQVEDQCWHGFISTGDRTFIQTETFRWILIDMRPKLPCNRIFMCACIFEVLLPKRRLFFKQEHEDMDSKVMRLLQHFS